MYFIKSHIIKFILIKYLMEYFFQLYLYKENLITFYIIKKKRVYYKSNIFTKIF